MAGKYFRYGKKNLFVQMDSEYEWLMSTADVAKGYGVVLNTIREHRKNHGDELVEGVHWVSRISGTHGGPQKTHVWTKRGVVRLGMFVKSPAAKAFRDAIENLAVDFTPGLVIVPPPLPVVATSPLIALQQTLAVLENQETRISALESDRKEMGQKLDEISESGDVYHELQRKLVKKGAAYALTLGGEPGPWITHLWGQVKRFAGLRHKQHYREIPLNKVRACIDYLDALQAPGQLRLLDGGAE